MISAGMGSQSSGWHAGLESSGIEVAQWSSQSSRRSSQGERGVDRFFIALLTSLIPGVIGLVVGAIAGSFINYNEFN
jgi:hypothetical protein